MSPNIGVNSKSFVSPAHTDYKKHMKFSLKFYHQNSLRKCALDYILKNMSELRLIHVIPISFSRFAFAFDFRSYELSPLS